MGKEYSQRELTKDSDRYTLRKTDMVILVAGLVGAGKSKFINNLMGEDRMPVGHTLSACTTQLDYGIIDAIPGHDRFRDRRLVIVDTPGFDSESPKKDAEDIGRISAWLESLFRTGVTLGGLIYLHDISRDRYSSLAPIDKLTLRQSFLHSKEAYQRVIIATTHWDSDTISSADVRKREDESRAAREVELKATHWRGANVYSFRYTDTRRGAWEIVKTLLRSVDGDPGSAIQLGLRTGIQNLRDKLRSKADPRAGKSTFINALMRVEGLMPVGDKLTACTTRIDYTILRSTPDEQPSLNRRIVIIDTPGFNGSYHQDKEIWEQIATWLGLASRNGITLGGVIYLHDISVDNRHSSKQVPGAVQTRFIRLPHSVAHSEDAFLPGIILATTKWDRVIPREGQEREHELKATHWRTLLRQGSDMHQFRNSRDYDGAKKILEVLLKHIKDNDTGIKQTAEADEESFYRRFLREILALFGSDGGYVGG
ncbi:hypothetical protein FPV67DRAFT_1667739 [Lyophyllum atratum]|nr:hypothetical protein FPV67DRAFT_1667739 [Lyophyllum atratum]